MSEAKTKLRALLERAESVLLCFPQQASALPAALSFRAPTTLNLFAQVEYFQIAQMSLESPAAQEFA